MNVLLDTCVISGLRGEAGPQISRFLRELNPAREFLSVITIGEINKGIKGLSYGKRREELQRWLMGLETSYRTQIISIDSEIALLWGALTAETQSQGYQLPTADGLIAATALRHDMILLTRNVKDFIMTGVRLANPWED